MSPPSNTETTQAKQAQRLADRNARLAAALKENLDRRRAVAKQRNKKPSIDNQD